MSLKPYIKPFRDQEYMYRKLLKEGLVIDDKRSLLDAITVFSYYRFKAYFIPFRLSKLNFKYSTNFDFIQKKITPFQLPKNSFKKNIHSIHLINLSLYTTNFTEPLSYQDSAFLKLPKFP